MNPNPGNPFYPTPQMTHSGNNPQNPNTLNPNNFCNLPPQTGPFGAQKRNMQEYPGQEGVAVPPKRMFQQTDFGESSVQMAQKMGLNEEMYNRLKKKMMAEMLQEQLKN